MAQDLADAATGANIATQKRVYADKLRAVMAAARPPLKPAELGAGLALNEVHDRYSPVSGFLSDKRRFRRSRPDTECRAIIDLLLAGELFLAVQAPAVPGARRHVVVAEIRDVPLMDRSWTVRNLAGRPVPDRRTKAHEWEVDALFDLFEEDAVAATAPPPRYVLGEPRAHVGLGQMRLSTAGRPPRELALQIVHAALNAGVRLIDTADSYGLNNDDMGHGEALVAQALASWPGPVDEVLVATKVGLRRPGGRWVPDTRPERLTEAVHSSIAALGVPRLSLVQLHVVHNRVPLADSLGALVELQRGGFVEHIGVCNVSVEQLDEARRICTVASVQHELSLFHLGTISLVARCLELGIPFLAHRPLGGHKRAGVAGQDPVLRAIADAHGVSAERVALAWLLRLAPHITPLAGTTRLASALDSAKAGAITLTKDDLTAIERRFKGAKGARQAMEPHLPPAEDVVIVMGSPASGKTSYALPFLDKGYLRLNRDELGGSLNGLLLPLRRALDAGQRRVVLDNTYATRRSRAGVVEVCKEVGVPVRVMHLQIDHGDAMKNAVTRMLDLEGRLLDPDEVRTHSLENMLPPAAVSSWFQRFEAPTSREGFVSVTTATFERRPQPGPLRRALLLDMDGTVRCSSGQNPFPLDASQVELLPRRKQILHEWAQAGWLLLGVSNQAGVGLGQLTAQAAEQTMRRTEELLDLTLPVVFCTHRPRDGCWCRKPMPGLYVQLEREYKLDRAQVIMVGDRDSDALFARYSGVAFVHADAFFAEQPHPVGTMP